MAASKRSRRPDVSRTAEYESKDQQRSEEEVYSSQARYASLPDALLLEMARLDRAGFALLPIGGADGKSPIVKFRKAGKIPLQTVVDRMCAAGSRAFAIRLEGMLVVDDDSDTAASREFILQSFGSSTVQVRTARGVHHYFRHRGEIPSNIRLADIHVDFKSGQNSFVLGAPSVRIDRAEYRAITGRLECVEALPVFVDRRRREESGEGRPVGGKIRKGSRNNFLFGKALEYVRMVDSFDELVGELLQTRNIEFDEPHDFADSEVEKIAKTVWGYRLDNRLWSGEHSVVRVSRKAIERLAARGRDGAYAHMLHSVLLSKHGHIPGQRFPIVPSAMRRAGLLYLSDNHVYRARDILIEEGLLVSFGQAGFNRAVTYQLGRGEVFSYLDPRFRDMGEVIG